MIHDNAALTVSTAEAARVEQEAKRKLLASRKLSLVVDLDQTIIHATVDPTVGEWQRDPENPNYESLKHVKAFQLVDDGPGNRETWYYIKIRPGLKEFLQQISKMYECHIYTMATRAYAQNIANIVDPDHTIFSDRILSRDESGSITVKSLHRLFPVDTKMVVIIDDRGDVWKWSDNLIRVNAYDFFVGIGDINSSFLPKKQEMRSSPKPAKQDIPNPNEDRSEGASKEEPEPNTNGTAAPDAKSQGDPKASAIEQLVNMSGGEDAATLQSQVSKQSDALAAQMSDRPLLRKQQQLEAEDAAASSESSDSNGENDIEREPSSSDASKPRHHLLQDDDHELENLEMRLRDVHTNFYREYDRKLTSAQGGRVGALRGGRKVAGRPNGLDLTIVPDIKAVMPPMKRQALGGTVLVLSGVVPLGTDVQSSDIATWAKSFGAQITEKVTKRVTHVIAARNRTQKVKQAALLPNIKIVTTQWLFDSMTRWEHLDEADYLVPIHPDDRPDPISSTQSSDVKDGTYWDAGIQDDDAVLSPSEESDVELDDTTESERNNASGTAQKLNIRTDLDDTEEVPPSDIDDASPIGGTDGDWADMHDEMAEFLGTDVEDSDDSESMQSDASTNSRSNNATNNNKVSGKRKRGDLPPSDSESEANDNKSRLAQRIKTAHDRSTALKNVASLESPRQSATPKSRPDDGKESGKDEGVKGDGENDEKSSTLGGTDPDPDSVPELEDDADALEREMMAAFDEAEGDDGDAG